MMLVHCRHAQIYDNSVSVNKQSGGLWFIIVLDQLMIGIIWGINIFSFNFSREKTLHTVHIIRMKIL